MLAYETDGARMDRHYRYQRYVYDLTRAYYLVGRRHLIRDLKPGSGEAVLEIGCGTAWNLSEAARRYPEAELFGIDVSSAMLETAQAALRRRGLAHRIRLRQADATSFDPVGLFGRRYFDRVLVSYALSMIPGWGAALAQAADMVGPGGSLHVVDFGQCGGLPSAVRRVLFAFLDHYDVTPRADLETAVRRVAAEHGLSVEFKSLHRGYTDYAVLRRR